MFNLILRLGAATFIAMSSNFLTKWQKMYSSEISSYGSSSFYFFNNDNFEKQNLYSLFIQREGMIMALNNITYVSMWTVIIPIILMFWVKTKDNEELLY